ncbi:MAG: type IV pilus assembly protein PilM [Armatimonadota bacterium]
MSLLGTSRGGSAVGIDIGSNLIKVVEAKPGKDGIQITALGVAPTPPGTLENDTIVDPQRLGQAIRELLKDSKISSNKSISSVSGQSSVIVRIIELPKMTKEELEKTMQWEVERHVPFSANEVVMDFQPIERPVAVIDDQNMEVLLAVAQQNAINTHVETLFAAGLDPVAIEVEPVAACRALLNDNDGTNDSIAIVNIGAAGTEIGIYQHGLLAFPRTVPLAGDTLSRAISDTLNISIEDAERIKREKAVVMPERASHFSPASMIPGLGDFQEDDATIGLAAPANDDSGMGGMGGMDFGFIPGLGFTDSPEPANPAAQTSSGLPEFDIDLNSSSSDTSSAMDFDLGLGDDLSTDSPRSFSPGLNTGYSSGFDTDTTSAFGATQSNELSKEQIFDAMAPVLMDLIAEIRRSLDYYMSKFQGQPDKILLCGGTAKMEGLTQLVQNELGIPTILANPLKNVTVFSSTLSKDYLEEVATIFPVSLGLAIRDMIGE